MYSFLTSSFSLCFFSAYVLRFLSVQASDFDRMRPGEGFLPSAAARRRGEARPDCAVRKRIARPCHAVNPTFATRLCGPLARKPMRKSKK